MNNPLELFGYVFISLISALSTVAGFGGGGLFLPIFILLFDIKIKYAIPLSVISVFASCVCRNIYYLNKKYSKNEFKNRFLINHTPGIIIITFSAITSFIGVLLHELIPKFISLILIIIILSISFYKITRKAFNLKKQYFIQKKMDEDLQRNIQRGLAIRVIPKVNQKKGDTFCDSFVFNLFMLFIVGAMSFLVYTIKSKEKCSSSFYVTLIMQIGIILFFGGCYSVYLLDNFSKKRKNNYNFVPGDILWNSKKVRILALASCASGLCSTYLGIGPGIILSPVLFSIGMTPKTLVVSAPLFMMYDTAIAIIQFIIVHRIKYQYAAFALTASSIGTLIGIIINKYIIDKFKKQYLIVFLLALLIMCSAVSLITKLIIENDFSIDFGSIC